MIEKFMTWYDKFIWRFNGLLLLIVCSSLTYLILNIGYADLKKDKSKKPSDFAVSSTDKTNETDHLELGTIEKLEGTDFVIVPLQQEKEEDNFKGFKGKEIKNYLLMNLISHERKWLWHLNQNIIIEKKSICSTSCKSKKMKLLGITFVVVSKDTNSNEKLDKNDKKMIQFLKTNKLELTTIISDLDHFVGTEIAHDNTLLFFYSRDGKSYFKNFNTENGLIYEEKEIVL